MSQPPQRPLVSCVMPTHNRRRFVPTAIELFLRQDWPERELVILDDGDDPVADLVPPDPRIRYEYLPHRLPLGAVRNIACQIALGTVIAHWDDDDWSAPWRLSYQVNTLLSSGADVCGLDEVYFLDIEATRAWCYVYPRQYAVPWVYGATMCYTKEFWNRHRFPEIQVGEGMRFLSVGSPNVVAVPDLRCYVAMIHPHNTSPKRPRRRRWRPVDVETVLELIDQPGTDPLPDGAAAKSACREIYTDPVNVTQ